MTGYFGDSTKSEIQYAADHGKPVRFTQPAAALRARGLGLPVAPMDITALLESEFACRPSTPGQASDVQFNIVSDGSV